MKVGIITFHKAINYGAVLQVFALQNVIKSFGIDVNVINYIPPKFMHGLELIKLHSGKRMFCLSILLYPVFKKRRKNFELFIEENLMLTEPIYNKSELEKISYKYDCIITGSDQVWNYNLTNQDDAYFLNFAGNFKKIAYAASFGLNVIPNNLKKWYINLLNQIDDISVREIAGQKIISALCDKDVSVVLDPTLLLTSRQWGQYIKKRSNKKYILIYTLNDSSILIKYGKKLKKETGFDLIVLPCGFKYAYSKYSQYEVSPQKFIELFFEAEYILTDSFHGTAFSINFNKKFLVEFNKNKNNTNSRLENIIDLLGLENRILTENDLNNDLDKMYKEINYNKVNKILNAERNKSLKFLKKSLGLNE